MGESLVIERTSLQTARSDTGTVAVIALTAAAIAAVLAFWVPAGQPYDEPSHWNTVSFYAEHHRLPELGDPGVTYEAQMGPVYYAMASTVREQVAAVATESSAFRAVRLLSAALVGCVVALTYLLAAELVPKRRGVALGSAAFMGLAPTVALFSGSVQNDTASLVSALAAAVLAMRWLASDDPSFARSAALGAAVGIAVLTKLQAAALLPALMLAVAAMPRHRRRSSARNVSIVLLAAVATSGWWFVRNTVLYGDLTGRAGVGRTGVSFPALPLHDVSDAVSWVRSLISVAWVPTEYYRNAFGAPRPLRALAVMLTVAVAALVAMHAVDVLRSHRDRPTSHRSLRSVLGLDRPEIVFVGSWSLLTFISYVAITFGWTVLSPRATFVAVAPVVIGVGVILDVRFSHRIARAVAYGVMVFCLSTTMWLGLQARNIPPQPYWIAFNG